MYLYIPGKIQVACAGVFGASCPSRVPMTGFHKLQIHTSSFCRDLTLLLSPLLKPHRARGAVSNLRTCVMYLGNHLQPRWYRIAHPVRTQTPSYPGVSIRLQAGNVGIPNKGLHH